MFINTYHQLVTLCAMPPSAVVGVIRIHHSPIIGHLVQDAGHKLCYIHRVSLGTHHKIMLKKLLVLWPRTLVLDEAGEGKSVFCSTFIFLIYFLRL